MEKIEMEDKSRVDQFLEHPSLHGKKYLDELGIDLSRRRAISKGEAGLVEGERKLIDLLLQFPVLARSVFEGEAIAFQSRTSDRYSVKDRQQNVVDVDDTIQTRLEEVRELWRRSGQTKDEFLAGNRRTNPNRAYVAELFDQLFESESLDKAARDNYQTSFWNSFRKDLPFQRARFLKSAESYQR